MSGFSDTLFYVNGGGPALEPETAESLVQHA